MAYNILKLKQDLTGVIHGTTLNKVVNLDGVIDRSARQVLSDVDPQETKRVLPFSTPIFQNVYTYALAPDVKGNKIIDIRPQINRNGQIFSQSYNQNFNINAQSRRVNQFTIQWNTAVRTILVDSPLQNSGVQVNNVSSLTQNGTWVAGNDASNLSVDNVNFLAGGGSLKFDLTFSAGNGYLTTSNQQSVDLTDSLNQSTWFLWTYLPTASSFSSVTLQFGSSGSNYYTTTATLTQALTAFANGWNLIAFPWLNLTTVGTPDPSAITYLKVIWNFTGTPQTGVLLNNITCQTGQIMEYEYYSKYLFRSSLTGAFQETVDDDSNLINLDTDSYNLLFNQVAYLTAQQLQGSDAVYDASYFANEYAKNLARYKALYKSEVQKPQLPYYTMPKPGYDSYLPRRWNR
jgi:hypothetical protein